MFIFNFIGLAFAAIGVGSAYLLTWPMSGLFQDCLFPAVLGGAFIASALDFRYRWIGEDIPPVSAGATTMSGHIAETASSAWRVFCNLLWPWGGAQILFVPIWLSFPAIVALDACGWLSFLHSAPPSVSA